MVSGISRIAAGFLEEGQRRKGGFWGHSQGLLKLLTSALGAASSGSFLLENYLFLPKGTACPCGISLLPVPHFPLTLALAVPSVSPSPAELKQHPSEEVEPGPPGKPSFGDSGSSPAFHPAPPQKATDRRLSQPRALLVSLWVRRPVFSQSRCIWTCRPRFISPSKAGTPLCSPIYSLAILRLFQAESTQCYG